MANNVTLHDLIEALANAVVEAQDQVERYQTSNIRRYFDENDRPRRIDIAGPSIRPDAEPGEEDLLVVPLLALVSATRLAIKDVEISMEVRLGSLTQLAGGASAPLEAGTETGPPTTAEAAGWTERRSDKAVALDLGVPRTRDAGPLAKVTLRVEAQEPTEGMARLLMELNKRIGIPRKPDTPTEQET